MKPTDLLNLSEIARELGVDRTAVQKWHRWQRQKAGQKQDAGASGPEAAREAASPKVERPLLSVAAAMEIEVPEAEHPTRPQYPWAVVEAFAKATGYMNADGEVVEEVRSKGKGRWTPVEPTIDPREHHRRRFYLNHAAALLEIEVGSLRAMRTRGTFVKEDGYDELARPYWWLETLQTRQNRIKERHDRRRAGPEPDGYLPNGQPFWRAGPENYWTRRWHEESGRSGS